MKEFIIFFISISLLTCLNFYKTLSFGLSGDDWLALYRYTLDFPTFASHFNFLNYINDHSNYNFADLIMGIIYRQFSFNPFPYYFISMIIRIITSISFYYAVSMATKDRLTAYVSAILFSVMFAGIETTNWVFNMNTYVSIILFNLFIYLHAKENNLNILVKDLILGIILGLSFIITPNRMHGLLFIIPFIALISVDKINLNNIKYFLLKLFFFYSPILGLRFLLRSADDIRYLNTINDSLKKTDFLYSFFASLSNSLIPEKLYEFLGISTNARSYLALFVLLYICVFFYRYFKRFTSISKLSLLYVSLIISFILMPLLIFGPVIMSSDHRYLVIPGAYIMILYASFFSILWKCRKRIFAVLFLGVIFFVNFFSLKDYFDNLSNKGRLLSDSRKQFSFLIAQIDQPKNNAPNALLFIPDDEQYLYNAITFGISYHLMLIDKRIGFDRQKAPFAVDNLNSLIDVLSSKDSKELERYGYQPVEIPLENVYIFSLQNGDLTNITTKARSYLKDKLLTLKK